IAVRTRAGLFDLSHMGEVTISGARAEESVQSLLTNDVSRLERGAALYSVMCNDRVGIVDDVVVYRSLHADSGGYLIVVNAACRAKDVAWMCDHVDDVQLEDESDALAL